ncbi:MAG: MaoC family dehydratase [Betaproteobacteria bacterium]|nr:MAG: MaoC family dehydratase [Betaproteobacteria bacterium]
MAKVTIDAAALGDYKGKEVAVSDWVTVTQKMIDAFADATHDHQWIHVDVERATRDSPFKAPIAHGFLTLSLLSHFLGQSIEIAGSRMGVNYGLNRVRFTDPVRVNSRLRARFLLDDVVPLEGGVQMVWAVTVECEGSDKPVLVAQWLGRRYV